MNQIFSISTDRYVPVSFRSSYLYDQYLRLESFLSRRFPGRYNKVLARPVLTENKQVNWYGAFSSPFSLLHDLSPEVQRRIKPKYEDFLRGVQRDINELKDSDQVSSRDWGELLSEVFNPDNNLIISDGKDWCVLWGWKFQSGYRYPDVAFVSPSPQQVYTDTGTSVLDNQNLSQKVTVAATPDPPLPPSPPLPPVTPLPPVYTRRPGLWMRFIHWLRRLIYRIWGLLLLIMLLLFIWCMCQKCNRENLETCCRQADTLLIRLDSLERHVGDLCEVRLSDQVESDLDERRRNAGAKDGKVTISLFWDTSDDIDLMLQTPSGEVIFYGKRQLAGIGDLDVDANRPDTMMEQPIENIYLQNPPSGRYKVFVSDYQSRSGQYFTDCIVRVNVEGVVRTFRESIPSNPPRSWVLIHEFNYH